MRPRHCAIVADARQLRRPVDPVSVMDNTVRDPGVADALALRRRSLPPVPLARSSFFAPVFSADADAALFASGRLPRVPRAARGVPREQRGHAWRERRRYAPHERGGVQQLCAAGRVVQGARGGGGGVNN